jgi:hypothetical protein
VKDFDMTMLTHIRGPFERDSRSSARRNTAGTGPTHLAMIKRFCMFALTVLLAGGAVAGVMALKIALYFWRVGY